MASAHQVHRPALLIGCHRDISLGGGHLPVPRQFHDGLDAHGMIGQRSDEAPSATMAGRACDARLTIDAVDQLA